MIVTRRRAEQIATDTHLSPALLRRIPGWGAVADAVAALARHADELRRWDEQQAAAERTRLGQLAASVESERAAVLATVAAQLRGLGVDPSGHSLRALTRAYAQVLDRLEARRRESELLGDGAHRQRIGREVQGPGMVALREAEDSHVVAARLIRDGLDRATALQAEIEQLEQAVEGVDPYALDVKAVRLEREFTAMGMVRMPGVKDARPLLDDQVAQTLASVGIDLVGE